MRFNEIRQLVYILGAEVRMSIQAIKLQELQNDLKIKIRETTHSIVKFPQTNYV